MASLDERGGWEVSEGRAGFTVSESREDGTALEHRSPPSPIPLAKQCVLSTRPEGHPYDGLRTNHTAVRQYEIKTPRPHPQRKKSNYDDRICKGEKKPEKFPVGT